jgi:predicted MFS family arabinose efflux permease
VTDQARASQRAVSTALIVAALLPFGLGYFLSYLFRAVNAVVAPDLVRDLGLTPGQLGLLTAAYLAAFALFQLPLGILLDRFGPRRVQAALVAIAGCGALLFAFGRDVATLTLARAVIGLGFAGGLMSGFKAVVIWVPEARRALANSCVMSLGAVGILVATTPTEWATQAYGWRNVFLGLTGITFAVALAILVIVPERATGVTPAPLSTQLAQTRQIYADPVFLAIAPYLAICSGAHIGIQTLWAGPWFRDVAGLDRMGVAHSLFLMAVAFFIGILVTGWIADRLLRRGVSLLTTTLGFFLIYFVAQIIIILDVEALRLPAWLAFGMSGQVAVLAYPWFSSMFGAALSGRSNGAINLLMFLSAFAVQYGVGAIIGLYPATPSGGYAPEAYRMAFGIVLALQLLALAWYLVNWRRVRAADAQVTGRT